MTALWYGVDPLAEKAPDWSPYRAFFNNPVRFIEPDGMFENETPAVAYQKEHNIPGNISQGSDGIWTIDDTKGGVSYFQDASFNGINMAGRGDDGVIKSVLETANRSGAQGGVGDYLTNPTGAGIGSDAGGDGHWGASRGNRTHKGIDFITVDGQNIVSPIDGRVRNFKGKFTGYPMMQIFPLNSNAGFDYIEILYVGAPNGVQPWTLRNVSDGNVIGVSVNLQGLGYPSHVGPHIHLQMWQNGVRINPTPFFFGQ